MYRTKRLLSFTGLFVVALAASISPQMSAPAQASLFSISEKEEIEAGKQTAAQARQQFGGSLPSNHPLSVRVRQLGERIAKLSERKNIPYSYEVLNNDKVLNAFAAPGGPIFVTKKLVETTANDAELAYVLGHETAHINNKHIVKAVEKQQKIGLGVGILGAVLGGGKSSNLFDIFSNVAFTVYSRGYSRDQENDADTVGLRYMTKLGFDPRAAISMLKKLETGGGGGGVDRYLATHPQPKDREKKVAAQIDSEKLMDVAKKAGGPYLTAKDLPAFSYRNASASSESLVAEDYRKTTAQNGLRDAGLANFGAPILLDSRGEFNVIMAPVGGFARWAKADVDINDNRPNRVTLTRGSNSIRLDRDSRDAVLNGRKVKLSAPVAVYNDLLYAPLGNLSDGVGVTASLSSDNRTVYLSMDGQVWRVNIR